MPKTFEHFTQLASTFRLTPPGNKQGWHTREPLSRETIWMENSPMEVPAVWYQQESKTPISAFEKKLFRWLELQELPVNEEVVSAVLGVVALLVECGYELVAAMSEIQALKKKIPVSHRFMLATSAGTGWKDRLEWQGYCFERVNGRELVDHCKKAKAPTMADFALQKHNLPGFETPTYKRPILDFAELFWNLKKPLVQEYGVELLESYFQATNHLYIELMWEAVQNAFLFPRALGYNYFNFNELRWVAGSEVWTTYSKLGPRSKHTWMGRHIAVQHIRVPEFKRANRDLAKLAATYKFEELTDSSVYPLLLAVSRSLERSSLHLTGARVDESFLFLVIAIEQVFSQKVNTTQAVTNRTAMVAYRAMNKSFSEAKKLVATLYDVRSKFVHQGKPVELEQRIAVNDLGQAVLQCLLRLCKLPSSRDDGFHEKWLKRLDFLIAGIEAEREPPVDELIECGVLSPDDR